MHSTEVFPVVASLPRSKGEKRRQEMCNTISKFKKGWEPPLLRPPPAPPPHHTTLLHFSDGPHTHFIDQNIVIIKTSKTKKLLSLQRVLFFGAAFS